MSMPNQEPSPHLKAFAMLGLVMFFWAGNSIIGRAVHEDIPPFTLAFVRWTCASLLLLPFAARSVWNDRAALLSGWKMVLLLGVIGIATFNGVLYMGLGYTTASNALLLQAAIPALVALFDRIIFGTRPDPRQAAGVAVSILGVVAIVFQGDPHAALRLHFGLGDALVMTAVVAWALYTVLLRLRPVTAPESFVAVTFWVGVVAMAPLAAMEWMQGKHVNWSWGTVGAFAYVSILPSLVSYFIYNWATGKVGPARAGQAITLMPLFGALLSALILGEKLYSYHWVGMGLILAGIVVSALALRPKGSAGAARD
ncbi:MAG TPA: DMT family transporter [Sphingomonadaceae bacterium]|nr:DMT family transporter [Sphingomonadaceae bacterium]